jgi:hypothetical protein
METYAERLNLALVHAGKKPIDLSKNLPIKQQTVSKLCRGEITSSSVTARIARYLNVSPIWLECGEGEMVENKKDDVLDVIERVPETKRPIVFEVCNFLSNPNVDPMDEIMVKKLIHVMCGMYPQNSVQNAMHA